ncbi:MAG: hypothetical protein KTR26_04300 [Flammeovirgaceae bacterium]|nr:hypothetical protein [Flammeovirgaceae bacterium]
MYLYNPNDSVITLNSSLVNLILLCEAKDTNGNWVLIEEPRPSTFWYCPVGSLPIEPEKIDVKKGEYIKLIAPCYTGSFKTELRYKLTFGEGTETTVNSEEFEGFINEDLLEVLD